MSCPEPSLPLLCLPPSPGCPNPSQLRWAVSPLGLLPPGASGLLGKAAFPVQTFTLCPLSGTALTFVTLIPEGAVPLTPGYLWSSDGKA
jgi:hypothetical protein